MTTVSGGQSVTAATGNQYTVLSGGTLTVGGGVTLSNDVISAGGTMLVSAKTGSASLSGDSIYGVVNTVSGLSATFTNETVFNGGVLSLANSNNATGTTISSGGTLFLSGSETATNTTLVSGGTVTLDSPKAVLGGSLTFSGGGNELLLEGKLASGGYGVSATISGFSATDTVVVAGGSAGTFSLGSSGGNETATVTLSGQTDVLTFSGAQYTSKTLSWVPGAGGVEELVYTPSAVTVSGTTTASSVTSSGYYTVVSGSDLVVVNGGSVVAAAVNSGGTLTLGGGFDSGANIQSGGFEIVSAGSASGDQISGVATVYGGGVSNETVAARGALVIDGGVDSGAVIQSGGALSVDAGTASGDQISGSATVDGGAASNETVDSGGVQTLQSGSLSNTTLEGGATLNLPGASILSLEQPANSVVAGAQLGSIDSLAGSLTFVDGHNTLTVAANAASDNAVISGYSTNDKIEVTGLAYSGATLSFTSNGDGTETATVANGGVSQSFTFSNATTYNASTMSLAPDGTNNVDLVLDSAPTIAFTTLDDLTTNQSTYIVEGTVAVGTDPYAIGQTVDVYENGAVVGSGTVSSNGYWRADVSLADANGANALTASVTDAASNTATTAKSLTLTAESSAPAFTPGNLVVSISGDGDGSGVYGDNQASPAVLEQITTYGTIVSQIVLPQTASGANNALSSEYGSSSEGALELSANGHSLTFAGYGVDDATFNAGGAAVYGDDALAQSTSIPKGQPGNASYTAVARVLADIGYSGGIDTSTALYNVFNVNNPRSVVTVNGSTFFVSGQGDKNATSPDQGVFVATDGASTTTALNTMSDTRDVEIYNGDVYVSIDSKQDTTLGGSGVYLLGSVAQLESATATVTPTILPGMNGTVTLTASNGNTVNDASGSGAGEVVNTSPETYFFANSSTLYIADGGAPKEGGVGDGGLQKWTLNASGTWTLDYTLSNGLSLINNNSGSATNGDTGLIGLTGKVVGDTVELYATTEPLNDLGATAVVAISDQLSATTNPGESFTTVLTASAGENIRGISFAPTESSILGTVNGQTVAAGTAISPFASASIDDATASAVDTLTIAVSGAGGTLTGSGLSGEAGPYTLTGSASALTTDLQALQFQGAVGVSTFTLTDSVSGVTEAVDSATTVDVTCFCAGVRILTARGEVPVEELCIGDLAVTAAGALRPIVWIGRRRLEPSRHFRPERVNPVRIEAGALAQNMPTRDLLVSPEHALWLDGAFVCAGDLINGATIRQEALREVEYFHVELETHDILLADGAPAESYLDCGNRRNFDNVREGALALHPVWTPNFDVRAFASPAQLAHTQARLSARAAALGRAAEIAFHRTNQARLAQAPRENRVLNPRGEGAVSGRVGDGGAAPSFWWCDAPPGVAVEIAGSGLEAGLPYVDVRFVGRAEAQGHAVIFPAPGTAIAAESGQDWTFSGYLSRVAGGFAGLAALNLYFDEYGANGDYLVGEPRAIRFPTDDALELQRVSATYRMRGALARSMTGYLQASIEAGAAVDLTLRVAGFQIERGGYASALLLPAPGAFGPVGRAASVTEEGAKAA